MKITTIDELMLRICLNGMMYESIGNIAEANTQARLALVLNAAWYKDGGLEEKRV